MLGLDMLDVAIGVVFVYLLLSLIASAAAEVWEGIWKMRAVYLEKGMKELLRDGDLVKKLYNHPLVNGLYEGEYKGETGDKSKLPSYIPARTFALAIMDLLVSSAGSTPTPAASDTPKETLDARATVNTSNVAMLTKPQSSADDAKPENIAASSDDPLIDQARHAVILLAKAAGNDAEQARKNIEDWYNTAMDRVSGWYKRRTQMFLFGIGLVVAIVLNVDSIRVVTALSTDKPKRDAIVGIATNYVKAHPTPPGSTTTNPAATTTTPVFPPVSGDKNQGPGVGPAGGTGTPPGTPSGSTATNTTATATNPPASSIVENKKEGSSGAPTGSGAVENKPASSSVDDTATAAAKAQTKAALDQLNGLGLPIGWKNYGCPLCEAPCTETMNPSVGFWKGICTKIQYPHWLRCWGLVLVGWLITALAVSLGAPFWFDMLNKIIVVRSTVKPQEKSGTEASKDPQKK